MQIAVLMAEEKKLVLVLVVGLVFVLELVLVLFVLEEALTQ